MTGWEVVFNLRTRANAGAVSWAFERAEPAFDDLDGETESKSTEVSREVTDLSAKPRQVVVEGGQDITAGLRRETAYVVRVELETAASRSSVEEAARVAREIVGERLSDLGGFSCKCSFKLREVA